MKKVIKSDTLWSDKNEIPYTDKDLRECIRLLSEQVTNFSKIFMIFSQKNENTGEVLLYLQPPTMFGANGNFQCLHLHEINLLEENWSDCIKECQREKAMLRRYFPAIQVTSNFR